MRRLRFLVLSGTGNSRLAAEWMAERARARGVASEVLPWERVREVAADGSALVLVLPTHAFGAPWGVLKALPRIPAGRGAEVAVVATRGATRLGRVALSGYEGSAAILPALLLAARGYRLRGWLGVDMPANWYAVHPPMREETERSIRERARATVERFADSLAAGRSAFSPAAVVIGLTGLLVFPVSAAYLLVGRLWLSRLFFADRRCTRCGLCAAACPFGAIRIGSGGWPRWTLACESCMRCLAYCPAGAIQVQVPWGLALLPAAGALARAARPLLRPLGALAAVAHPLLTVALAAAAYPLLALLARLPGTGRLLEALSPSRWFRRAPREVPLERLRA